MSQSGLLPGSRHPCKSLSRGKHSSPDARFGGARTNVPASIRSSHLCLSAVVPAFAEPDIHSLSRAPEGRHRRLSLCSLPVLKQFEESLGSVISLAQSAKGRTWQPARCVIPFILFPEVAVSKPPLSGNLLQARSRVSPDLWQADTRPSSALRPEWLR